MKKIILLLILGLFLISTSTSFAKDRSPYVDQYRASDSPFGDGDPWDDPKKSPRDESDSDVSPDNVGVVGADTQNDDSIISNLFGFFKHIFSEKKDEQKRIEKPKSSVRQRKGR